MTMMKWTIKNGMYTFIGKTVISQASPIHDSKENKVKMWHLRLGHISHKELQELDKQGLLDKENLGDLPFFFFFCDK